MFGADGVQGIQSRDVCFPLHIVIGKDNKNLLQMQFTEFFDEIHNFEDRYATAGLDSNVHQPAKKSLAICHPANMSALQKTVGGGGAMKNAIYACYCYNMHVQNVHVPNTFACPFCISNNRTRCFHQEVVVEQLWP